MSADGGRDDREAFRLDDAVRALPGVARLGVGAAWRVGAFATGAATRAGSRLVKAAARGESLGELTQESIDIVREQVRELLGLEDDERLPGPLGLLDDDRDERPAPPATEAELHERGRRLLARSSDVTDAEPVHPAIAQILDQLSPDEARILKLLHERRAVPVVDVRTASPLPGQSQLVASRLTMLAELAGCRYLERQQLYLNNLDRLGLVFFSKDELDDTRAYQLLEAQPSVQEAMTRAGRGRTYRKAIRLTPFGEDLCRICFAP